MRELWPSEQEEITSITNDKFINQAIEDLTKRINEVDERYESTNLKVIAVDDYVKELKEQLSERFETNEVDTILANITSAVVEQLTSKNANLEIAQITQAAIDSLTADRAGITNLTSTGAIDANEMTANKAEVSEITADTIKAQKAEIAEYSIDNAIIDTLTSNDITSTEATIDKATITEFKAQEGTISELISQSATIDDINLHTAEVEHIIHNKEYTTIPASDKFYIQLPTFYNGDYKFVIFTGEKFYFASEAHNSGNSFFVRYSNGTYPLTPLTDLAFYDDRQDISTVIYELNGNNLPLTIYYESDSFANVLPPQVTSDWPVDTTAVGFKEYPTVRIKKAANVFNRPVIFDSESSTSGTLELEQTSDWALSELTEPVYYDTSDNRYFPSYRPDQSLNKADDVEFNSLYAQEIKSPVITREDEDADRDVAVYNDNLEDTGIVTYDSGTKSLQASRNIDVDEATIHSQTNINSQVFVGTREQWNNVKHLYKTYTLAIIDEGD